MDVEEKDRRGKQKGVIINGEEERGKEKKPEKSQDKKYKNGTNTIYLYMVSSLQPSSFFLLPSSFFLLPSSFFPPTFFLLPSSFFLLPSPFY
ncbi:MULTISPECIES: hypothetical protein [unclassified Microcoleus]|uniref:hypothetical protein n=1 Tax=unclassified Microcoleus TaxID=2642155 RepID=UPI002FCF404D